MPAPKHGLADEDDNNSSGSWASTERKRKRKSRWAKEDADKTFIPGMPTTLPADATEEQKEQYLLQLQIEDATRRLRSGDLGIPPNPEDRSPSPEPIYNNEGKRMNTREYRVRKKLEEERHEHIQHLLKLNANYKPPADYKPPIVRVSDKVMIPQDDHPEINFVGLLIGPRGNTLKNLEKDTGAKIIIRGKGSVKEGKIGRKDGQPLPGEDEPLHAYITANDPENVRIAVDKIQEIIKEGIEIPEEKNDLRKQQLRELALLNGTLRDNDGLQKLRQIAEAQTIITNQIICTKCGGAGHIAKDCVQKAPSELVNDALVASGQAGDLPVNTVVGRQDRAKMDSEYMSLMAELGQVAPETVKADIAANMPKPLMSEDIPRPSKYESSSFSSSTSYSNTAPSDTQPTLSSDYGYGGRRSRFDQFDAPKSRGGRSRFDQGPGGGYQSYNDQPPPPGATSYGGYPTGGYSSQPPPPGTTTWSNAPPGPPAPGGPPPSSMMNSNRWGPPTSGPPPPLMSQQVAPPGTGSRFGPPPQPPSSSSWSHPPASSAPWQSGAPPLPPWQQSGGYGGYNSQPAAPAPPPPPPPSSGYGSYSGYSAAAPPPLPPPPPPPPPQ